MEAAAPYVDWSPCDPMYQPIASLPMVKRSDVASPPVHLASEHPHQEPLEKHGKQGSVNNERNHAIHCLPNQAFTASDPRTRC